MDKVQYQIITTIKESNKGNVYLATVEGYGFPVIVKWMKHGNRNVFEALKTIQNEHLPQIYRIEECDDGLFVVEEYIEGELLSDYLTAKKFTEAEYMSIAKQLCVTLRVLHEHIPPLIHRDIKPSNVIVNSKGVVKLIDFDSSRLYKEESDGDTRLLGTEKYAAPEQYGFSQTDCRSDIYSLGVVFGMFPKVGSRIKEKRWKKLVEKCTLFAPESRFQTVAEIERELKKIEKTGFVLWAKITVAVGMLMLFCSAGILLMELAKTREVGGSSDSVFTSIPQPQRESELTPVPTSETTPRLSPTLTAEPEPTPTPTPTALPDESYRTTKPEWRDVETDPDVYVYLKQEIRNHNMVVMYCFKDRMEDKDYLIHIRDLERSDAELYEVSLYSYRTNEQLVIDDNYIEVRNNIIHIDGAYMKALAEGYYMISMNMRRAGEKEPIDHGMYLYVAENDVLEDPDWWLQNTTLTYYGEEDETLHAALKNDSGNEISMLMFENREVVDESLYRILYDGRVIEFSNELLRQYCKGDQTVFFVTCMDGSAVDIYITNHQSDE